ncbi:MAG TPA: DUF4383 domain-containing protein [Actinomycetota bacterium]|nr:DUF4383 domain-containing protein [Actinomycetota bacterium]
MAIEREHIHEVHEPVVAEERAAVREPFGIAQFFSLAIGIFLIVIGAIGLARAGVHHFDSPVASVGPFTMTPLLAAVNLFLGLVGLIGAAGRAAARGVCMFIGPVMLAGGIVALIQGVHALGWNHADGVIYIILGAVAIIAAIVTPPVTTYAERRVTAV